MYGFGRELKDEMKLTIKLWLVEFSIRIRFV